jgi:hypothetical protein
MSPKNPYRTAQQMALPCKKPLHLGFVKRSNGLIVNHGAYGDEANAAVCVI